MKTSTRTTLAGFLTTCGVALALLTGCQSKGPSTAPNANPNTRPAPTSPTTTQANDAPARPAQSGATGWWQPTPKQIVFFPGTRWEERNGQRMIYTALELRDAMGDPLKVAGTIRLQWVKPSPTRQNDTVLNTWTIPLKTQADQVQHWSAILRAYVFDLTVRNENAGKNKTILIAVYDAPNAAGNPVRAEFELKPK